MSAHSQTRLVSPNHPDQGEALEEKKDPDLDDYPYEGQVEVVDIEGQET